MKKAYRIKKEKEFQTVINARASYANRNIVLFVLPKENQAHFRVGISVGKKIGNAVMRNRVKRQLREAVWTVRDQLKSQLDFVLIARPAITSLSTEEVIANLRHVCRLAKIMNEEDAK